MCGDTMACYNGRYLTAEERARCTREELKTCIYMGNWSTESEAGLFLMAPRDEGRASQGVRVNSSMYKFVSWARAMATTGTLSEQEVMDEYERRLAMVNVEFRENYETCPLSHRHYVTIVAIKNFKGTPENPVELIADYDHDESDGQVDRLTRAKAFVTLASDDEGEAYEPGGQVVVFFLIFFLA